MEGKIGQVLRCLLPFPCQQQAPQVAGRGKALHRRAVVGVADPLQRYRLRTPLGGQPPQLRQILHRKDVVRLLQNLRHPLSKHPPHCALPRLGEGDARRQFLLEGKLHLRVLQGVGGLLEQGQVGVLRAKAEPVHTAHRPDQLHRPKRKALCPRTGVTDRQLEDKIRPALQGRCRAHPFGQDGRRTALGKVRAHHHRDVAGAPLPQLGKLPGMALVKGIIFRNDGCRLHIKCLLSG